LARRLKREGESLWAFLDVKGVEATRGNPGGGHDFCIVHLTLPVFVMMHGFQQIITQAERCDNFVDHELALPEVKEAEAHGFQ